MARIELLVGTVHGNAQDTAEYLQSLLQARGHQVRLDDDPQLDPLLADPPDLLLVCTSTTGQGELPDNIVPFFYRLQERFPLMPAQRFAVLGLGDSAYDETFGMGGKQFEALLLELQAQPLVASLTLDAASAEDPFEQTRRWSEELLAAL